MTNFLFNKKPLFSRFTDSSFWLFRSFCAYICHVVGVMLGSVLEDIELVLDGHNEMAQLQMACAGQLRTPIKNHRSLKSKRSNRFNYLNSNYDRVDPGRDEQS